MSKVGASISPEAVERYLRDHVCGTARLVTLAPLGAGTQAGLKAYGYGKPLELVWTDGADVHHAVLRTMGPDPYGHDRAADRLQVLAQARDDFPTVPRHVQPLAVGTLAADGTLVPMAPGEAWLLTTYAEGELYARDLDEAARRDAPTARDLARAEALADYLVALHRDPRPPADHVRDLRETVGGSEGLAGIADGWPADHPVADAARLCRIEQAAVAWRWRMKPHAARARRTHGDFHPFNLLFREGADFTVLDASRRAAGEPADDVTCLALNYLFFALRARGRFDGAGHALWTTFWRRYLDASGDRDLLRMVPPFFAWRTLVVTSPVWYPDVTNSIRHTLITWAERLLAGEPFDPFRLELTP